MLQQFIVDFIRARSRDFVGLDTSGQLVFWERLIIIHFVGVVHNIVLCSYFYFNSRKLASFFFMEKIVRWAYRLFYFAMLLLSLYCAPLTSRFFDFFGSLPFNCLTLFRAWFIGVLLLRELPNFSQSSFLFFLTKLLKSAMAFFHWIRCC